MLNGTTAQTLTSNSGRIKHLEIDNPNGVSLSGALAVYGTFTMTNGIFNISSYKLTLAGALGKYGTGFGTIKSDSEPAGNASDGGLELCYNTNESQLFPVGTNANSTLRYTPGAIQLQGFSDDGYIAVSIEDNVLQTINLGASTDKLSYNWRVSHHSFTVLPRVSLQFVYADADISGAEANYVPGSVVGVSPFTRAAEDATDISIAANVLTFNGSTTGGTFPGIGTTLHQASYTAAAAACFTGIPVYFIPAHSMMVPDKRLA